MKVAIVGCCHGELNRMYERILSLSTKDPVDLVLVTGDFQSVRSESDLESMSVPLKYRKFGDFLEYYEGRRSAPILTLFIGGNHESSNYLRELFFGGWVCPTYTTWDLLELFDSVDYALLAFPVFIHPMTIIEVIVNVGHL